MSTDETGGLCRKWRMECLWSLNPATYTGLHVDGWDGWTVPEVEDGVLTISQSRWAYNPQTPLLTLGFMSTDETGGLCRKWRMEYLWSLNPVTYFGLHVDGWDWRTVPEVEDGVIAIPQPHYLHWASCRWMRRVDCGGSEGWSTYDPS